MVFPVSLHNNNRKKQLRQDLSNSEVYGPKKDYNDVCYQTESSNEYFKCMWIKQVFPTSLTNASLEGNHKNRCLADAQADLSLHWAHTPFRRFCHALVYKF